MPCERWYYVAMAIDLNISNRDGLEKLLSGDLDFHDHPSSHKGHSFHDFTAKFLHHLAHIFINQLTEPGDVMLDLMMGSGTALAEAATPGRRSLGFDIDPLAVRIIQAKTMLNTCNFSDEKLDVLCHCADTFQR